MVTSKSRADRKKSRYILLGAVLIIGFAIAAIRYFAAEAPVIPEGKEVIVCNVVYRTTVITDANICQEIKTLLEGFHRNNYCSSKPMRVHDYDILIMVDDKPWHIAVDQDSAILYHDGKKFAVLNPGGLYQRLSEIVLGGARSET